MRRCGALLGLAIVLVAAAVAFAHKPVPARHANGKPKVNNRVVIGVLAQPTSKKDQELHGGAEGRCYIAASYTKWVEGAGARALPVPYNVSNDVLDRYFENINGLLFTGGGCNITDSKFFYSVKYLYEKAVEANEKGDYFPVWGICQGFQLMNIISSTRQNVDLLKHFDTLNYAINLDYTPEAYSSRMFTYMGKKVMDTLSERYTAFNNHNWGVVPEELYGDAKMNSFWRVLSTSVDREGKPFVSTMEGRKMPFYALQWHPEKPVYEWEDRLLIEHDVDTIEMGQKFANFFIAEARKSSHTLSEAYEDRTVLAYAPTYTAPLGSEFEQCYFFDSITWQD
eukprot:tig00020554_g10844.t1